MKNLRYKRLVFAVAITAVVGLIVSALAVAHQRGLVPLSSSVKAAGTTARVKAARVELQASASQDNRDESIAVSGSGHIEADETRKQYVGATDLVINNEGLHGTVTMTVAEPFKMMGDGNQVATTSYRFDFGDGNTLTTSGQLALTPAAAQQIFRISSALAITGGTGTYANARGNLTLSGVMLTSLSAADWNINGTIEN